MNDDTVTGRKVATYRIERLLGKGGMAEVYYAWDESLERPAAVKVIGAELRGDQVYAERFVQEARAVSQWRHEHILQVYYAGQEGDVPFFAMEYIDGLNLEQILSQYDHKGEFIPHDDVIRIGRAIAGALDYAHSRHVIHRDVKPSNVMVDKENRVVLADFGLAMDVQRGSMGRTFGTPHYVAPEQALNSADAVPQSDLYSLGIILYEMLTGVVPFDDPSSMSVALKHLTERPPAPRTINPNLSEQVEAVLLKALAKEPQQRYANGAALIDALEAALQAQRESSGDYLALPPVPAGADGRPARPLSRLSVMDSMRLSAPMPPPAMDLAEIGSSPTPVIPEPPVSPSRRTTSRKSPSQLLNLGAVGALVFLIVALGAFLLMRDGEVGGAAEQASEEAGEQGSGGAGELPVLVAAGATATPLQAAATDLATARPVGDGAAAAVTAVTEPEDTPEPTVVPENTAVAEVGAAKEPAPEPTAVPPTAVPPTAEPAPPADVPPAAEPTVVYPDGRRLEMTYDANSFYLYNPSAERIRVRDISFEALDGAGRPLRYGMAGNRWTQFYAFLGEFACYRIEPFGMPGYLRPAHCRNYSASVTPAQSGTEVFWIERPEAVVFRVLWAGQEVARCGLGTGSCVVFVPGE